MKTRKEIMPVNLTLENVQQEVKQSSKPVVIDIYADWCGPCQQMAPIFEALEKEMGDSIKFAKINVDDSRELAVEFGVTSIPTFVFVKNGEPVAREIGYMPKEDLTEKIKKYLG
jgi:thioredoxin 1